MLFLLEDECKFRYLRQPPTTTTDNCNPYQEYNQKYTIEISLECLILTKRNLNGTFQIKWFKENMTEDVVDLGLGFPEHQTIYSSTEFITNSRYHDRLFLHQQYNPTFLGKYWCQVINTTADPDQPLMRSNVFTLLPPDNYTKPRCAMSRQVVNNITCADLADPKQASLSASTATNYTSTIITAVASSSSTAIKPTEKG